MSAIDLWLVGGASGALVFCVVPTLLLLYNVAGDVVPEVLPGVVATGAATVAALVAPTRGPLLSLLVATNVVWDGLGVVLGVAASFTVVGTVLMTGVAVLPGVLGCWVGAAVLDARGPVAVRVVATAAGCADVSLCVGLSFLPASSVGGNAVLGLGADSLLLLVSVVTVVMTVFCALTVTVTLSEIFDAVVLPSVPLTEQAL